MGIYKQRILPRLCDLLLDRPFIACHRREILAHAHGEVLEIGFGTGLNLPHYPQVVRKLTTVDPNVGMHRLAQQRLKRTRIALEMRVLRSERLPFENATFDCVVSTFTLCSIEDVRQALGEVYRLLKPGGQFLFLEHGLSPERKVQRWQHRLNWLQMRLGDGCRLDRDMDALIWGQPFSSIDIEKFYLERTPRTHGYAYRGTATK